MNESKVSIRIMKITISFVLLTMICYLFYLSYTKQQEISINIFLSFVSIVVGIFATHVYSKISFKNKDKEKIEYFAQAAYRHSKAIDETIKMYIVFVDKQTEFLNSKQRLTKGDLHNLATSFKERLLIVKNLTWSANDNWKDMLPPEAQQEYRNYNENRVEIEQISSDVSVVIEEFKVRGKYGQSDKTS